MKNEIERKFFIKEMPDLTGIEPLHYERYFLERGSAKEVRVSRINDSYVYEEKLEVSDLERTGVKREISKEEFEDLKQNTPEAIIRDGYHISSDPNISIKIYHGRFEGLIRAEVEFESEEQATNFIPPSWMGNEMTGLPIARDSKLLDLTNEEFKEYLK